MACTAGKFQDVIGALTCKECPSGRKQPNLGADKCDECQVINWLFQFRAPLAPGNMTNSDTGINDTITHIPTLL